MGNAFISDMPPPPPPFFFNSFFNNNKADEKQTYFIKIARK